MVTGRMLDRALAAQAVHWAMPGTVDAAKRPSQVAAALILTYRSNARRHCRPNSQWRKKGSHS